MMAAPQWQLLQLPLGRGLAQGEDARLITPGSVGEAENVLVDRAGRYTKRPGWGRLPKTGETGLDVSSPDRVDVAGRELLQADRTGGLWSWGPGRERWESVGSLPQFRAERAPLVRTARRLVAGGLLRFGAGGRYELPWWQAQDGASFEALYQLRDSATGALIGRDLAVYAGSRLTTPVGATIGTTAWLVYAGGTLDVRRVEDALTTTTTTIAVGPSIAFDACSVGSIGGTPVGAIAWTETVGSTLFVEEREEDLSSFASTTLALPGPADEVALCRGAGDDLWVGAIAQAAGSRDILVWRLDRTSLAVLAGPITVESRVPDPDYLQLGVDGAGNCWVTYAGNIGFFLRSDDSFFARCILSAGSALQPWRKAMWRVAPGSAPIATDEGLYIALLADGTGPFSTPSGGFSKPITARHLTLVRLDASLDATPPAYAGLLAATTAAGALTVRQRWVTTPGGYRLAAVATTEAIGDDLQGLDVVDLEVAGRRTARSLSLAQQAPCWSLAGLWGFDGYDAHDLGILQPPALTFDSASGYGTGTAPYFATGDYLYLARYEAIDDRGVVHVSPFSEPMVLAVPASTKTITVGVRNTQLTRHGRLGGYRRLSVALYRTDVNGAAGGVVRYYRLTELGDPDLQLFSSAEGLTYV
ncbi:MAG: hypothetical protein MUF64_33165, partial [Polyangiaceae bacterium]|nr:hypothetical protein [Polyangiaceae bacterium]